MDEFFAAISDARYLKERTPDQVTPVIPMKWPPEDLLKNYPLHEEEICFKRLVKEPMGRHLLLQHILHSTGKNAELKILFLEEVSAFYKCKTISKQLKKATLILAKYIARPSHRKPYQGGTYAKKNSVIMTRDRRVSFLDASQEEQKSYEEPFSMKYNNVLEVPDELVDGIYARYELLEQLNEEVNVFGDVVEVLNLFFERVTDTFRTSSHARQYHIIKTMQMQQRAHVDKFVSYRILGKGGFGEVHAQKHTETGAVYAVKLIMKTTIEEKNASNLCWNERSALSGISSSFVVGLKYAFECEDYLYLVMDLLPGGDLCFHLNNSPRGRFPMDQARFHAAEVLLGIRHMHEAGFVNRDIKPDNILIGLDGHCKISDLGLAVPLVSHMNRAAGTVGYMAPEMLRRDDNGHFDPHGTRSSYFESVDWWSFGCVIYEMLVGKSPFRTSTAKQYYEKTFGVPSPGGNVLSYRHATCSMEVSYEISVFDTTEGKQAEDLIRNLLQRDSQLRYGSNSILFKKLIDHKWFTDSFVWNDIEDKILQPPFVPSASGTNTEPIKTINKRGIQTLQKLPRDKSSPEWEDWYYLSPTAFQEEMVQYFVSLHKKQLAVENDAIKFCIIS